MCVCIFICIYTYVYMYMCMCLRAQHLPNTVKKKNQNKEFYVN